MCWRDDAGPECAMREVARIMCCGGIAVPPCVLEGKRMDRCVLEGKSE